MKLAPPLKRILPVLARSAARRRERLCVVGGCVRDGLLGAVTRDLDLVFEGAPRVLAKSAVRALGGRWESFGRFSTVRITLAGGARIDIARARAESYPRPGALPEVVPATIEEDLKRRDFSINAMAREVRSDGLGSLLDLHGGKADLESRRLRVLHAGSFEDDPTRLFRGARYAGRLGLGLEKETRSRLREAVEGNFTRRLSRERVRQELVRILDEQSPAEAMALLKRWGLWGAFHPDFRYPGCANQRRDTAVRLALCSLAMPEDSARAFLRSMPLEREWSRPILNAIDAAASGATPARELEALAKRALEAYYPRLSKAALGPRLLRGEDLKRLGLKPGGRYAKLLEAAARAQWRGIFRTRKGAVEWLKSEAL